ncbi:MAG: hypothetical protein J6C84_07980 [Lachnospiraceae bacterium]|nr:hypothetical protein [Lachnospiraceae bacterium]
MLLHNDKGIILACLLCLMGTLMTGCSDDVNADIIEQNKTFLIQELGLEEDRALGAANTLEKAGCGLIVEYADKVVDQKAYSITLVNENGDKYYTAFDRNGYIGPIRDANGKYLYAPID